MTLNDRPSRLTRIAPGLRPVMAAPANVCGTSRHLPAGPTATAAGPRAHSPRAGRARRAGSAAPALPMPATPVRLRFPYPHPPAITTPHRLRPSAPPASAMAPLMPARRHAPTAAIPPVPALPGFRPCKPPVRETRP